MAARQTVDLPGGQCAPDDGEFAKRSNHADRTVGTPLPRREHWNEVQGVADPSHAQAVRRVQKRSKPVDHARPGSKHQVLTDGQVIPLACR